MAHLHLVVEVPDADPTLEDPEDVADGLLVDPDHYAARTYEVAGAHWPWTRDQLRARLLESLPGRVPSDGDMLTCSAGELLDAVEAILNPPWED